MDYNTTSSFDSFEFQIGPTAQGFLREAAKWATFLSILGFIIIAFMVFGGLIMIAAGGMMGSAEGMEGMPSGMGEMAFFSGGVLGTIYLLAALLYFFPVYYLYKFASKLKASFANNNTEELTSAFENLKSHYKFMGILAIITIVLYILGIIAAVVVGVSSAM